MLRSSCACVIRAVRNATKVATPNCVPQGKGLVVVSSAKLHFALFAVRSDTVLNNLPDGLLLVW